MPLNLQTFKTRALTSVAFIIVMLCGLLINYWTFFILFTIIHFGCWYEYEKIASKIYPSYNNISALHKYVIMLAGWTFMFYNTNNIFRINNTTLSLIGLYCLIALLVVIVVVEIFLKRNAAFNNLFISFSGLLYISFSCGCMVDLRSEGMMFGGVFDLGLLIPLILIATIWINDTMAYVVGSFIGKTQLSKISPKKTWEGTIGGIMLATTVITILGYSIFKADVMQLIIITLITCIAGVIGDLFESKLKRLADIKDSGNIMPGHGGFLDRFDSLLLATTFVWLYIKMVL